MDTNIKGLVRTLDLRHSQGMMPLFEAVSNAMDAVEDRTGKQTAGRVDIHLLRKQDLAAAGSDQVQPVDGVRVVDDGVGFDAKHLASFRQAYTEHKLKTGGKGVGRFTYLKVFSTVEVASTFRDADGALKTRRFRFSIDQEVFDESVVAASDGAREGTELTLSGMQSDYAVAWPFDAETVAERIVMHFLIRFASLATPVITLHDQGVAPIDLRKVFEATVHQDIEETTFDIGAHQFGLPMRLAAVFFR